MKRFIIDTTGKKIGIGFFENGETLFKNYFSFDSTYNKVIFDLIKEALKKAKLKISDFDLFIATSGPGSFTGIRIGISIIKAFSYATNKDAAGISILDAMAEMAGNEADTIMPALDAKRGEVYTAKYVKNKRFSYNIMKLDKFIFSVQNEKAIGVFFKDDNNLVENVKKNCKIKIKLIDEIDLAAINEIFEKGRNVKSHELIPLYIRETDAETNLKKKVAGYGKN